MTAMIGIRREDKSIWETRVPVIPGDVAALIRDHGLTFSVQASPNRAFPDAEFSAAGATLSEGEPECPIIMGVKEIPANLLRPNRTYVTFSHTIKGQAYNMPVLRRLMELHCQLIDYEKIADERGRRLVFFGRYAGLAGMIDSLWALGKRWQYEGVDNPFSTVRQTYQYADLNEAIGAVSAVGEELRRNGLPQRCRPLVCGFAGYGQVSKGAQEIYDLLPVDEVAPDDLPSLPDSRSACYKVVFREEHMAERIDGTSPFELQEYYRQPERYRGTFARHVPHLTVMINGIYWEPKYPRLITKELVGELFAGGQPRLRVIGDISCDINGSVECTERATEPDEPVYVFEPASGTARAGVEGKGPVILAVDHLPCELPVDASKEFSRSLTPFLPALSRCDFTAPFADCGLPRELAGATIVYQGTLTADYAYLRKFVS